MSIGKTHVNGRGTLPVESEHQTKKTMANIFTASNGKQVKLTIVEGTVLSVAERENVVINQDPSTTRYNATLNQTYKQAGDIYSEVIKTSKVWIRKDNGKDDQIDISEVPVPLMAGHRVRLVVVTKPDEDMGYYWAAKNLNTDAVVLNSSRVDNVHTSCELGLTQVDFLKKIVIWPARNAAIVWAAVSLLYYFTNDRNRGLFASFGEMIALLFIYIPIAFYYAVRKEKNHLKPMSEVTAEAKKMLG